MYPNVDLRLKWLLGRFHKREKKNTDSKTQYIFRTGKQALFEKNE